MKAAAKEISLKSPEDPYVYRLITLRNGLQCLLIATDKEKEAAKQKRRGSRVLARPSLGWWLISVFLRWFWLS